MISFLQPLALLGLLAAAIPTILHLMGRRLPPIVIFPAVRYLTVTEREHSRRLKLRNLLLLILRTVVILLLVLAAARPVARIASGDSHPPTAIALVIDNSLSSTAVVGGRQTLGWIREAAREALDRVGPGDRLWFVLADGIPRRVSRPEAAALLQSLTPSLVRMDLAAAVRTAARAVADDPLPAGEVAVYSDLQASALSPGEPAAVRVLAWRPPPPPGNRWIDSAYSEPAVWSPEGSVIAAIGGAAAEPSAVRLMVEGRDLARAVAAPGDRVALSGRVVGRGWVVAQVQLDPDELRADDRRSVALHLSEPAAVAGTPAVGTFVLEALDVLEEGERVREGSDVLLDDHPRATTSIVFPPSDPTLVGALNRTLAARQAGWRLGELVDGEWEVSGEVGAASGARVFRRHRLVGSGTVLARAGGEPWLVREENLVLVASRMETEWTELPVSAAFIPFLDLLINRIAARESWIVSTTPEVVVELPASATALIAPTGPVQISSDRRLTAPIEPDVYFLQGASGDTVGALEVNYDPRESRLEQADQRLLRATLGRDVRLLRTAALGRQLFRGTSRADLTSILLIAAILTALAELAVASAGGSAERRA